MPDPKALSTDLLLHIAKEIEVPMHGLVAVIELLDDGGTVPFIARYRKEATGAGDVTFEQRRGNSLGVAGPVR